jgi:hypothetical protein
MASFSFYCTHCGAPNEGQAAFCFACGHALQARGNLTADNIPAGTLSPGNLLKARYHIVGQLGKGAWEPSTRQRIPCFITSL